MLEGKIENDLDETSRSFSLEPSNSLEKHTFLVWCLRKVHYLLQCADFEYSIYDFEYRMVCNKSTVCKEKWGKTHKDPLP